MPLVAVPFVETLDKTQGNSRESFLELPSNQSCAQSVRLDKVEIIKKAKTLVVYKYRGKDLSVRTSALQNDIHANAQGAQLESVNDAGLKRSLSPYCCDPLLQFVDVADFKDEKILQRNFADVLRIRRMGFPVKVLKQNWFPGLICIPVFHCQRCLALWTEAAHVPTFCSEVNRSVYGRIMPISITKCDLLTNLFKHHQPTTTERLCNTQPKTAGTPDNNALRTREAILDNTRHRKPKSVPVAEFVDIEEQLRKFRKKFSRPGDKQCPLNNDSPSNVDLLISGKENAALANSTNNNINNEQMKGLERAGQALGSSNDEIVNGKHDIKSDHGLDGEFKPGLKLSSGCVQDNDPIIKHTKKFRQCSSSGRTRSNNKSRKSESGCIARPPTRTSLDTRTYQPKGLYISSKNNDINTTRTVSSNWWTRKQSFRQDSDGATKFNQSTSKPLRSYSVSTKAGINRDDLSKRNEQSMQLARDVTEVNEERLRPLFEENWKTNSLSERPIGFDIMGDKPSGASIYLQSFKWDVTRVGFSYFTLLNGKLKDNVQL